MSVAKFRIRLLPALMGAMALLLTVKLGGLWQELSVSVGSETEAQTQQQVLADQGVGVHVRHGSGHLPFMRK